jgi:beta-N-acetylhexosaminidase
MKKFSLIALSLILILSLVGCGQSALGKAKENPVIRGQITKITQNPEGKTATLLVEGQKEEDTQYDKASVRVTSDTKIYKGDSKTKLSMTDIKEGMKVEIYWDGPVAESYPVQMGANIIKILE